MLASAQLITTQTFEPRAIPPEALDFNARFHAGTLLRARVAASECYRLLEEYLSLIHI